MFSFPNFGNFTLINTERGELRIFDNCDDLSIGLAEYIGDICEKSAKERRAFAIALSDGSMDCLGKLHHLPFAKTMEWHLWQMFWVEEHAVPMTKYSTFRRAREFLLGKIKVRPEQVHSVNGIGTPDDVAEKYQFMVRQAVKEKLLRASDVSDNPKFDLIILGLGTDGHIASLFPNHPLLDPKVENWVACLTDAPEDPAERITFTLPVINAAANVAIVATGEVKAQAVHLAVDNVEPVSRSSVPARMVRPEKGKLVWFLDQQAASRLECYTPPPKPEPFQPSEGSSPFV